MPTKWVLTVAAVAGLLTSGLYLSVMGGPAYILLQYLTQLPLFLVGLGLGFIPTLLSSCVALVVALITDVTLGLVFFIGYVGPTLLVTYRALLNRSAEGRVLEWYPAGRMLAEITIYALLVLFVALIWFGNQDGGLAGVIERAMTELLSDLGNEVAQSTIDVLRRYLFVIPGLMGVSWIMMMAVNGALAQWMLASYGRNLRPSPTFREIKVPRWLSYCLILSALLAFWGEGIFAFSGGSITMILMAPFFFQGIGVVHQWSCRSASWKLILVAFYLFIVLLQWPILLVVGLGVADEWINFRRHRVV